MSLKSIEKLIHATSRAFITLSMVSLFVMMVFVGIDVVGRYVFNRPIPGSIDFVTILMLLLVFPSFGYLTSLDGQVRTDIIFEKLSKKGRGICNIVTCIPAIFFVGLMAWQLGARAWSIVKDPPGISTAYFQWPHLPFMMIGAACLVLMLLEVVVQLFHAFDDAIHDG